MRNKMKAIDIPQVWAIAFVLLGWLIGRHDPLGLRLGNWLQLPAGLLVGAGAILMVLALQHMRGQRTTVWPHGQPARLVQTGIFARSRNPIYLGDVLILTGLILWFDAILALPLIPIFILLIERRFIEVEEARLQATFGALFADYSRRTGRWWTLRPEKL